MRKFRPVSFRNSPRNSRNSSQSEIGYENLENRQLLAADVFSVDAVSIQDMVDRAQTTRFMQGELVVAVQTQTTADQSGPAINAINWDQLTGTTNVEPLRTLMSVDRDAGESVSLVHLDLGQDADIFVAMQQLDKVESVMWSSPNFYQEGDAREYTPSDSDYPNQYHHPLMETDRAWDIERGSADILIGITDDGVELTHEDLQPNIWVNAGEVAGNGIDDDGNGYIDDVNGWDFASADNNANPDGGSHGTHVAGIAAGRIDNAVGIAGVAGGSTILPLKFTGGSNPWTGALINETFAYAVDNGANIVNTSYFIDHFWGDPVFTAGLQYMHDNNVLHFNSAGNGNAQDTPRQNFDQTLLVANTDDADIRNGSSNYGYGVDLAAPGTQILSTVPGNAYANFTGTSMAAPDAAGVAALIWSHNPSWTNVQVAAQLLATTDFIDHLNPGFEAELGTGRANSYSALTATLPSPTLKFVNGLPADGTRTGDQTIGDFTLAFDQVLDIDAANNTANYDLRAAGADGVFGTGDDVVKTLTHDQYMLGTNLFEFQMADGPMTYGHYRLTISNLVNAFGEPLDGDGDGFEGDAYVQEFWVLTPDQGIVEFDNTTYRTRDVATITVTDQNFVGNQITVAVSSSAGDSEVVVLNSTGFGTWVGAIQTASGDPSLGDGKLNVADDDVITVVNTDPDDGFGNTFNSSDTALISSVVDFPLTGGPVVLTSSVITSTIEIDEFGAIGDLDLRLDISHGRTADLEVVLIAPDNTRIRLVDSAGGTGADFDNTYFDESAPRSINEGSSPYRGRFRPLESFDALFNKSIRGTWTLEITDDVAGVVGTLNEWSLRIDILPEIQGTTGNDVIVVHLGTPFVIVDVNGKESRIASEQGSFSFDALGGHDQITIYGSAGDDSVIVRDSQVQLDSAFSFFGQSIEDVKIFGGGGHDIARIYGSQRDEVFRTFDGGSSLVGDGFKIEMMGYDQTSAFARGGNDAAYFVDSAGNDRFFASTIFANLKTDNAVYNARDFETVAVHSSHGGFDIAQLFGGSGDDELFANPGFASLKAGGEKVNVAGFSRTWTHGGGGNDIATLIGSAGNDVYNSRPNSSYLYGDGYFNQTVGFEVITANADSGEDQAIIYDTPGDDTFYSTPTYSVLFNDPNVPSGTPFRSQANGFDKVSAIASSAGFDQATFIDSAGNDRYVARDSSAFLIGDGFLNFTQFFNSVTTRSTGGADVAIFHSSIEDDRFFGSKSESYLRGSTFFNRAMNFKNVTAYLDLRGLDIATLHDSEDDDTYIGTGSRAVLFSDNYIVNAIGADLSIASSLNGGTDKLATGTIDYELRVNGNWT